MVEDAVQRHQSAMVRDILVTYVSVLRPRPALLGASCHAVCGLVADSLSGVFALITPCACGDGCLTCTSDGGSLYIVCSDLPLASLFVRLYAVRCGC